ncbi:uncharacterized protein LOC111048013 isoform X1 [Nilaparvata lugens]|uniref:uncharacterized protein LOC111048013 isoform X1 n=1 Tax=Nilaparvata lugens TaxID=108931 RepID=UPI00193E2C12|nr:uncharacterized protein LOC111048013 isoform X1 [Nilaparvata lugens]
MICQTAASVVLVAFVTVISGHPYAHPHAFAYPYAHIPAYQQQHQQRQFYYPAAPQAALPFQQQFPFAAPPTHTNYVYLAAPPQQAHAQQPARLVSAVPSALRYQPTVASTAVNGQYVVVYPGQAAATLPGAGNTATVVLVSRQGEGGEGGAGVGGEGEGPGWTDFFGQIGEYFSWPFAPTPPESLPVENPDAGSSVSPANPEKVQASNLKKQPEAMSEKEVNANTVAAAPQQKFVVVGQPQFFGHYAALQKANPVSLPTATNGAISSFLLLRNGANAQQIADEPVVSADGPGSAALAYHKLLVLSKQQKDRERMTAAAESASVTVDAKDTASNSSSAESGNEESENVESSEHEEVGPSIAQAKPQAISLAGPGGVAAAAPVGTALVGPGGMALSAPHATAVAGPTQGAPISIAPANKAAKTYFLAKQNPQYLYQFKP